MIKAIIFDCFGVLVTSHWEEFWSSMPTPEKQAIGRELDRAYNANVIDHDEFVASVADLAGKSIQETEGFLFSTEHRKNNELLTYIQQELVGKYKIGILSNIASDWITKELLTQEEQSMFDDIVASYKVNMAKPDPRIFELSCSNLGVEPSEAVMIDDIERYCTAAKELHMKAVQYKNLVQMKAELSDLLADAKI